MRGSMTVLGVRSRVTGLGFIRRPGMGLTPDITDEDRDLISRASTDQLLVFGQLISLGRVIVNDLKKSGVGNIFKVLDAARTLHGKIKSVLGLDSEPFKIAKDATQKVDSNAPKLNSALKSGGDAVLMSIAKEIAKRDPDAKAVSFLNDDGSMEMVVTAKETGKTVSLNSEAKTASDMVDLTKRAKEALLSLGVNRSRLGATPVAVIIVVTILVAVVAGAFWLVMRIIGGGRNGAIIDLEKKRVENAERIKELKRDRDALNAMIEREYDKYPEGATIPAEVERKLAPVKERVAKISKDIRYFEEEQKTIDKAIADLKALKGPLEDLGFEAAGIGEAALYVAGGIAGVMIIGGLVKAIFF